MKTRPTGYWTLMCNPRKWEIDRFLASGLATETHRIIPYNRRQSWFEPGQLGVLRVGRDGRTQKELNGRKKLVPGVYGVVEITHAPKAMLPDDPGFYLHAKPSARAKVPRIRYRLIKNLIHTPLLLEDLADDPDIQEDPYLVRGQQSSLMPLHPIAFRRILELLDMEYSF